jgi:hypothetical protein
MSEQSSNTSPTVSAFYDPDSSCWRTCQASFQLDLDEEADWTLLQRLPDWGTTHGGALCVQATPEHLTSVRDGSASPNLPTPVVNDMGRGKTVEEWDSWTDEMKKRHGNGNGHGPSLSIEAARLLPTPLVDSEAEQSLDRYGPNLGMVLKDLVSTNPRFSGGAVNSDDDHPTLSMGTGDSRTTLSSG